MSILIKDMELPRNCEVCPLNFYECALLEKSSEEIMQYFGGDSRHPDCPLVEVPTPHGRLIDAEAIPWIEGKDEQDKPIYLLLKFQVEGLPTIIESE